MNVTTIMIVFMARAGGGREGRASLDATSRACPLPLLAWLKASSVCALLAAHKTSDGGTKH